MKGLGSNDWITSATGASVENYGEAIKSPPGLRPRRTRRAKFRKMDVSHNDRWIVARSKEEAKEKAMKLLSCTEDKLVL